MNEQTEVDGIHGPVDRRTDGGAVTAGTGGSLVVLDPTDPTATLKLVLGRPDAADQGLHLLLAYPTAEFEDRRRARVRAGVTAPYDRDQFAAEADREVTRLGHEWLDRSGTTFVATGTVGRARDHVLDIVATGDYDRVFVPAARGGLLARLFGRADIATHLVGALPEHVALVTLGNDGAEDGVIEGTDRAGGLVEPET